MKFKILSMLIILGVLSVLPLIYTGKFDPVTFITGFGNKSSGITQLTAKAPENLRSVVTDEKVQVYKWRDEYGVMQFSNTPPATDINARQVVLDPNSNLVRAVSVPEKEKAKQVDQTGPPNPYSVKGMKKVIDDAGAVEQVLQQRHEAQQKMMNNL
jgi:hypothetical protein